MHEGLSIPLEGKQFVWRRVVTCAAEGVRGGEHAARDESVICRDAIEAKMSC